MKTRKKGPDAPGAATPWDEIVPGLWMGGHFWNGPAGDGQPAVAGSEFDLVVSLVDRPGHGPDPGVEHLVGEIPDDALTAGQIRVAQELAAATTLAVRGGRTVLVRCRLGYNRSGLVVAQTMVDLGWDVAAAIDLIRQKRSAWALHNEFFVEYLTTGLETAFLLSGLDAG